jgi:type II secretory pathway pseudopilin PulG
MTQHRRGVTLAETLIACAVLVVLAGLIMPVLASSKRRAQESPCTSNLRQLYVAFDLYCGDHGGWDAPPPSLVAVRQYTIDAGLFQCPADRWIQADTGGTYPAAIGAFWTDPAQVRSPFRISYWSAPIREDILK